MSFGATRAFLEQALNMNGNNLRLYHDVRFSLQRDIQNVTTGLSVPELPGIFLNKQEPQHTYYSVSQK